MLNILMIRPLEVPNKVLFGFLRVNTFSFTTTLKGCLEPPLFASLSSIYPAPPLIAVNIVPLTKGSNGDFAFHGHDVAPSQNCRPAKISTRDVRVSPAQDCSLLLPAFHWTSGTTGDHLEPRLAGGKSDSGAVRLGFFVGNNCSRNRVIALSGLFALCPRWHAIIVQVRFRGVD